MNKIEIINILKQNYPQANCSLNFKNPWELLAATILSAQCTDQRVNLVTQDLFKNIRQLRIMQIQIYQIWNKILDQLVFLEIKLKIFKIQPK